ncbi:MAG: HD domain-containing protein [Chloroflexota bacterium]|nr:HD domain-containing protein [Chloroflexota bacterium]
MFISPSDSLIVTLGKLYQFLVQQNCNGYVVGGFIRDWLLGKQTNDIDIAVEGNALTIAKALAKNFGGKFVLLDEVNSIARVIIGEEQQLKEGPPPNPPYLARDLLYFDFCSFHGDIESDLARRDFTIDAMAVELGQLEENHQLKPIDPFHGKKDLENKIIRAVSEQVFTSDSVRLLRAVRLAAELEFTIEPNTETLIRHNSQYITDIAGERVREEFLRILNLHKAAHYLHYLDDLGLLLALIPELTQTKGVEQPVQHFWDVFEHSLQIVAATEFLIRENNWEHGNEEILTTAPWSAEIDVHLSQEVSSGSNRRSLLKLGGLFHDIAKPKTKSIDDTGRARFLGHAKEGAEMTASVLERLRFSRREIDIVKNLVYYHLRPVQMTNENLPVLPSTYKEEGKEGPFPSRRAIYRYFRDTGDNGVDILFLALADYLASRGPLIHMETWQRLCHLVNYILTEGGKQENRVKPVKLVNGHDLMNKFGLTPGPLVGKLLSIVYEAQASGEITTDKEALALVKRELLFTVSQIPESKAQQSVKGQRSNLSKTKV